MARRPRRTFTAEFKAKVVLDLLAGHTTPAEVCREHQLRPSLVALWKAAPSNACRPPSRPTTGTRPTPTPTASPNWSGWSANKRWSCPPEKSLAVGGWDAAHRRQVVTALADQFPVRWLCRLFDCPRAALHRSAEEAGGEEERLRSAVRRLAGLWPTDGYRRITALPRRERRAVNGKRVRRVMPDLGLAAEPPPRRVRTTDSNHPFPRHPNLVADITDVRVRTEFVYLPVLLDVFTRHIRGWHLGRSLDGSLPRTALNRAWRRGTPAMHHSDQGVQSGRWR